MVKGSSSKNTNISREQVLRQLRVLAETAELYEIRHAANYIVTNISERTTKDALRQRKSELSKLLDSVSNQVETITFEQAIGDLLSILPESVAEQVQPLLFLHTGLPLITTHGKIDESSSSLSDDETTGLIGRSSTKRHGYGGL